MDDPERSAWFGLFVTAAAATVTALVFSEQWIDAVAALAAFAAGAVLLEPRHRPGADAS